MPGFIPHPVRHNYWRTGGIPPHGCKRPWGFTIMELIIVVIIIGVLAALALPSYRIQTLKIQNQEAVRILMVVWEAQIDYKRETGSYTWDIPNDLAIDIPAPKYFSDPLPYGLGSPLPSVVKLGMMFHLREGYALGIREDGSIRCLAAAAGLCQKMGFPDW